MLHIVTLPPTLHPGSYFVDSIDAEQAAKMIREAYQADDLFSHVNFDSTCAALRGLTGIVFRPVVKVMVPPPRDRDVFLHVRKRSGVNKGHVIGLMDLEFFKIEFVADNCQQLETETQTVRQLRSPTYKKQ